jgi:hypothetical protein
MRLTDLGIGMDQYDRRARLMPALLLILPAALAVVTLAPDDVLGWGGGIALIAQAGGSFLLAQMVGDIGKRKEPKLFESFGGRPTEMLLSHQQALNRVMLAERHKKLAKLFPKIKIPTADAEQKDPKAAFEIYTACCDKLRGLVRAEKDKFPDVHRENIHYGFRRNLWALKPAGIIITAIALMVVGAEVYGSVSEHQPVSLVLPVIAGIDALLLVWWIFFITKSWVKRAAVLYAERLMEALDALV